MTTRWTGLLAALVLLGAAFTLPRARRAMINAVVDSDAAPSEPAPLPTATGRGLSPAARTRVVLIDGLAESVAATLPHLTAACASGLHVRVDVGFPTVSLPVEAALWTGLTQQQSGIVANIARPGLPTGIPHAVPGSIAIAEDHGYIVRSLGFATAEPAAGNTPMIDKDPAAWKEQFRKRMHDAVAGGAKLAFVHILRVDNAGHHEGGTASTAYAQAAKSADDLLAELIAAAPAARWFVLSDHGHLPTGGHGGEERSIRQVSACIFDGADPSVLPHAPASGPPLVHVVDLSRAIADSAGVHLDAASRGRPLDGAIAAPLTGDQALPRIPITAGGLAVAILAIGLALTTACLARFWLVPLWFVGACAALVLLRGEPTLSLRYVYQGNGLLAAVTWIPALLLCAGVTYAGLGKTTLARVLVTQLAIPVAATLAALVACGGLPALLGLGSATAPVVPRYTAYASPLVLMTAHGCAAVALAVLAKRVLPRSDRSSPPAPPRSSPSAAP